MLSAQTLDVEMLCVLVPLIDVPEMTNLPSVSLVQHLIKLFLASFSKIFMQVPYIDETECVQILTPSMSNIFQEPNMGKLDHIFALK
jgi:hypothetical protein